MRVHAGRVLWGISRWRFWVSAIVPATALAVGGLVGLQSHVEPPFSIEIAVRQFFFTRDGILIADGDLANKGSSAVHIEDERLKRYPSICCGGGTDLGPGKSQLSSHAFVPPRTTLEYSVRKMTARERALGRVYSLKWFPGSLKPLTERAIAFLPNKPGPLCYLESDPFATVAGTNGALRILHHIGPDGKSVAILTVTNDPPSIYHFHPTHPAS